MYAAANWYELKMLTRILAGTLEENSVNFDMALLSAEDTIHNRLNPTDYNAQGYDQQHHQQAYDAAC